jgi:hypothetical protein
MCFEEEAGVDEQVSPYLPPSYQPIGYFRAFRLDNLFQLVLLISFDFYGLRFHLCSFLV